MAISRFAAFDQYLRDNAIPINGLSGSQPYGPATVTIDFKPEATAEQIVWANAAKDAWDWRTRRDLARSVVATNIAGLTSQQQNALMRHCIAKFILEHQDEVTRILAEHGFAVPFDEVAP